MPRLANNHILIMGLGRFGGGAGVARFAASQNARVTITDSAPANQLDTTPINDLLEAGAVTLIPGPHDESLLDDADLLVVNPAVPRPWLNPFINAARTRNIPITTEIALAIPRLLDRLARTSHLIAVTGSAGKCTTAAMIHHALQSLGRPALLAGNIGGSLLNHFLPDPDRQRHDPPPSPPRGEGRVRGSHLSPASSPNDTITPDTTPVLELSSAQLHWLRESLPTWSPPIAVVTSYAPNHLDWHADEPHYLQSKQHLLANQQPGHHAVLAQSVSHWPTNPGVLTPPLPGIDPATMTLPGDHNRANAALAAAALTALGIDKSQAISAAASFPGLPHRLQSLGTRRGVLCINDSKSTTPESTALAVAAISQRAANIHLIAGGADKHADLSPLANLPVAHVHTLGSTGPAIAAACRQTDTPVTESETLADAVAAAAAAARNKPGSAILLSPACASWDQFPNYEARGQLFASLIDQHLGAPDDA